MESMQKHSVLLRKAEAWMWWSGCVRMGAHGMDRTLRRTEVGPRKQMPQSVSTTTVEVRHGHLSLLKCARENGGEWNTDVCASAATGGHLDTFKWLRKNNCPWREDTCTNAARYGHLEVLKWARENGCAWDYHYTFLYAANGSVVEWLRLQANGSPRP